jgi:hypothetical protein
MRLHTSQFGHPEFDFSWLETWFQAQGKAIGAKYAKFRRAEKSGDFQRNGLR